MTLTTAKELKTCGHHCFPSTVPECCACADERPVLPENSYPTYTDGTGWTDTGARDDGYCPVCNTKNFDVWQARIKIELDKKASADDALRAEETRKRKEALHDRQRAAASVEGGIRTFRYSNGDVYEGGMRDGERNGFGRMEYGDGAVFKGLWKNGMHEGLGTKNWIDGITYVGNWKDDMMHGMGKYTMQDEFVMEGLFEEDVFCDE